MREIEFRGKSESHGWVYGGLVVSTEHNGDASYIIEKDGKILNGDKITLIRVIPATVGQYTGLKDKNGKKIYEGDLVAHMDKTCVTTIIDGCFFLKFAEQRGWFAWHVSHDEIEVVGNIHDNPELFGSGMTEIKNQIPQKFQGGEIMVTTTELYDEAHNRLQRERAGNDSTKTLGANVCSPLSAEMDTPEDKSEIQTKEIRTFDCVLVKAGTINCGNGKKITVEKDFWCAIYPVTHGQWEREGKSTYEAYLNEYHPKVNINWYEATEFAGKVGGRLLTETEWEFAARGGIYTHGYEYAGSDDLDKVGWYDKNSNGEIHKVGQKKPNELGLYDMNGNVLEWTSSTCMGEQNYSYGVFRGGCWMSESQYCCVTFRNSCVPSIRNFVLGLRVAFDVDS